MSKLEVEYRGVESLIPYKFNSRTHDDVQVDKLVKSIQEFGFTNPVLIDDRGVVIAGHGRLIAAKKAGIQEVPCIQLSHLTDEQRRAYIIADNKLGDESGWDEEMLARELIGLRDADYDLGFIGFDDGDLDQFLIIEGTETQGLTDDDEVPDVTESHISSPGDVWLLGNHRLCCGDSTKIEDLNNLLGVSSGGQPCDACWTDPPYNVAYQGGTGLTIENDNMSNSDFIKFMTDAYKTMAAGMKEGAPIYIAHADKEWFAFRKAMIDAGFKLAACLVWVKNQFVLGRSDYQWKHEPILYGWKEGAAHKWYGGRKLTSVIEAANELPFTELPDGKFQIDIGETTLLISGTDLQVEEVVGTVVRAEKPVRSSVHPTMKPVGLILGMVRSSSRPGDKVLDLFGGSGSTMIACEKIGRHCRMMELDPQYADVIVRRWQDFTGQKARRESDDAFFNELVP